MRVVHAAFGAGSGREARGQRQRFFSRITLVRTFVYWLGISIGSRPPRAAARTDRADVRGAPRGRWGRTARIFVGGGSEKNGATSGVGPTTVVVRFLSLVAICWRPRQPLAIALPSKLMRATTIRASAAAPAAATAATPFRPAKPTLFSVPVSNKAAQVRWRMRGWVDDGCVLMLIGDGGKKAAVGPIIFRSTVAEPPHTLHHHSKRSAT